MTDATPRPNYRLLVFATALCCLMFELVLSRLVDFHLGADNAYLALPIAFLGLAVGSLYVHFRPSSLERFDIGRQLMVLVGLCVCGLLFAFVFFSWVMPATPSVSEQISYMGKKTVIFVAVMVMPFFWFGRILTSIYQLRREEIGSIYAADLLGAALACALTPIAFAFGGLPTVIVVLIVLSFVPLVLAVNTPRARAIAGVIAVLVAVGSERLIAWADRTVSYEEWDIEADQEELERAWNEHSRVALIKRTPKNIEPGKEVKPSYKIIHNNARSNVHVYPYRDRHVRPRELTGKSAPWLLGRAPEQILVMFAGTGAEMVTFDEFADGKARITGVELNGLCSEIGRENEELSEFRIAEFLDLPHIDLVTDEGRHFLTTRPEGTAYDFIFLGSKAATTAVTGHTTKYLDTVEAYHAYLDVLSPSGLLVFHHQPIIQRIQNLRQVFAERGIDNFEDHVIVLDHPRMGNDDLIVSPSGFTDEEIEQIYRAAREPKHQKHRIRIRYLKAKGIGDPNYVEAIEGPQGETFVDDRPFLLRLDVENYQLRPATGDDRTMEWYISWIKITTVLVLSAIAALFIGIAAFKRDARAPAPVVLYLLLTGFCFMLCEVAIMAKLELFLTQPLLSMAAVLSLFLLTSGIGSAIYPRLRKLHDTRVLAGLTIVGVLLVTAMLDWMVGNLLHLPVALKLVMATVVTAPLGILLGLFYPHLVSCLVDQRREKTVSISYGLSTLSSVVGSAYALAAMINLGFNALLYQAAIIYAVLLVFALIYQVAGGRWLSRSS
ncbi:MAG TPA: hypothetical protein VK034_29800 [Enhygromyxa sp.]|nr:hypothetical protein [Enhygromyxa sp.]